MGQIYIKSRRSKIVPQDGCIVLDLTSKSDYPWVKFSPFFPHEDIPIPWSKKTSQSVEGIWQGLKVFTNEGIDESYFLKKDMKNMKRGGSKRGAIIGHQRGIESKEILNYVNAKKYIYLPAYNWILEKKLQHELLEIKNILKKFNVIFLDFNTSQEILDNSRPISHAAIVKSVIEKTI